MPGRSPTQVAGAREPSSAALQATSAGGWILSAPTCDVGVPSGGSPRAAACLPITLILNNFSNGTCELKAKCTQQGVHCLSTPRQSGAGRPLVLLSAPAAVPVPGPGSSVLIKAW